MTATKVSYLDLINACDCFPHEDLPPDIYRLKLPNDNRTHGLMRPEIVARMPWTPAFKITHDPPIVQVLNLSNAEEDSDATAITAFANVITKAIDADVFEILHQRHSEPYLILGARSFIHLERFSHALFGIVARGAHMTAYVRDPTSGKLRIWVPRRGRHLFTYPGKLDSTVAGGIKATDSPLECMLAEAMEEASLPEALVREQLKSVGTLTYVTRHDSPSGKERGLISPEVLYVYDMELSPEVVLKPHDDEVEQFYLMDVQEAKDAVLNSEFKTNSAIVLVDFFVRHGIITAENEPDYVEITSRMHRRLPIATSPNS